MNLALDTGVLGMVCHPRKHADVRMWFRVLLGQSQHKVYLPEVVDFELRRELLRIPSPLSLKRLDELPQQIIYLPLDTATMRDAAALWAQLWNTGQPLGSGDSLGADAIVAAQARSVGATVVTENARHLARMVPVVRWYDVGA